MNILSVILYQATRIATKKPLWRTVRPYATCRCISTTATRSKQAADDPNFVSIVDNPPNLVRTGRRHGPGLIILGNLIHSKAVKVPDTTSSALIPITAFALGTWQVQRLDWKSKLIARLEDRLIREPLPLPPLIDPSAVKDFDYRRVYATGHFRHDQEMLIGPRIRDGNDGYLVVTPLEREGNATTILVNRGWIPKKFKRQRDRPDSLPKHEITIEGLLREPWKKNLFTPENSPQTKEFYFPDVAQMAELTGSQAVWVEETMGPLSLIPALENQSNLDLPRT
jgi:surfeit locus 1 family protein